MFQTFWVLMLVFCLGFGACGLVFKMIDTHLLAVATKQVKEVMESSPSVVQNAGSLDVVSQTAAPVANKVSSGSAAFSDFITSLPFYILNLFFFTYLLVIWSLMVRWVGQDCERRGVTLAKKRNYQALTLIFNFPGLLLYLMSRPSFTLEEVKRAQMEEEVLTLELAKLRRELQHS